MKKLLWVALALLIFAGLVWAKGYYSLSYWTISDNTTTTYGYRALVTNARTAKYICRVTQVDTLRIDTLHVTIETGKDTSEHIAIFDSVLITGDSARDTVTFQRQWLEDSLLSDFEQYCWAKWTFADSTSADSETIRPNGDGEPEEWSKSTGTHHYTSIDEASTDTGDYIYVTGRDSTNCSVFANRACLVEPVIDSVKIFAVADFVMDALPDTGEISETVRPDSDEVAGWTSTGANLYGMLDEATITDTSTDYIYYTAPDSTVYTDSTGAVALGEPVIAGEATIDSIVLCVVARSVDDSAAAFKIGLGVNDTATANMTWSDSLPLTEDTATFTLTLTTHPVTGDTFSQVSADTLVAAFENVFLTKGGQVRIFQAYAKVYYTHPSFKIAACICGASDTVCTWSDILDLYVNVGGIDTFTFVVDASPRTSAPFTRWEIDSLGVKFYSVNVGGEWIRVHNAFARAYYDKGKMSPSVKLEERWIIKE